MTKPSIATPTCHIHGKTFLVRTAGSDVVHIRTELESPGTKKDSSLKQRMNKFQRILNKTFAGLNDGTIPKHYVMGKYCDAGYFTTRREVSAKDTGF